jgi:hypothetical protein
MKKILLSLLVIACLASVSRAQLNTAGGAVQITQGGNTAVVTSGGALDVNMTQAAGSNLSVTGSSLNVNCTGGCSSTSFADNGAFTEGTTNVVPMAGEYNSSIGNLTSGHAGTVQLTIDRMMYVNVGKVGGTAITVGQTTMSASIPVAIASNQSAIAVSESGTWTVGLNAGTSLIGYTRPPNGCGNTFYESGLAFVPNSLTSVTTTSTCVQEVIFNNVTSSAVTLTSFQDQTTNCNSGACAVVTSFSIPANSSYILRLEGAKFSSGIKWQAGTANAITGDVVGNQ